MSGITFKEYLTSIGASEENMPARLVLFYGDDNASLSIPSPEDITPTTKMGIKDRRFALYTNKNLNIENMLTDCYVSSDGVGHVAVATSLLGDFDTKMTVNCNGNTMIFHTSGPFNRLTNKYLDGSKIYSNVSNRSIYTAPNSTQNAKNMLTYNSVVQKIVNNKIRKLAFYIR